MLKNITSAFKISLIYPIVKNSTDIEFETYERKMIQVFMNIINNSIDAFENKNYDKFIFFETKKFENKIVIKWKIMLVELMKI